MHKNRSCMTQMVLPATRPFERLTGLFFFFSEDSRYSKQRLWELNLRSKVHEWSKVENFNSESSSPYFRADVFSSLLFLRRLYLEYSVDSVNAETSGPFNAQTDANHAPNYKENLSDRPYWFMYSSNLWRERARSFFQRQTLFVDFTPPYYV